MKEKRCLGQPHIKRQGQAIKVKVLMHTIRIQMCFVYGPFRLDDLYALAFMHTGPANLVVHRPLCIMKRGLS